MFLQFFPSYNLKLIARRYAFVSIDHWDLMR